MTRDELQARLLLRSGATGLVISESLACQLATFLDLLFRWNKKINLTGFTDVDSAIDRLILEPLAAVPWLPASGVLLDIGSGGGSPAIPLKLALPRLSLTMVEVNSKKAAFLREAVRVLGLEAANVENCRFEDLASRGARLAGWDIVSVRAVRLDAAAFRTALELLRPGGLFCQFHTTEGGGSISLGLDVSGTVADVKTVELLEATLSSLTLSRRA